MEFSHPKSKGDGTVFDRAASSYGRVGPDFFSDLGTLLVEHANVPAGSRMIDIGAGTGAVSLAASHRLGSSGSVLAVDFAPEMLAQLWQRLHGNTRPSLMTAVMDAARLGVGSGVFDVTLSGICSPIDVAPTSGGVGDVPGDALRGSIWNLDIQRMVVARRSTLELACDAS